MNGIIKEIINQIVSEMNKQSGGKRPDEGSGPSGNIFGGPGSSSPGGQSSGPQSTGGAPRVPKGNAGKRMLAFFEVVVIVIVMITLLGGSVYRLSDGYHGVIVQFGKLVKVEKSPGIKFKVPVIQRVYKVNMQERQKIEYGYRTQGGGSEDYNHDVNEEGFVVIDGKSNNLSIIDTEIMIEYVVNDAYNYLFKVDDVEATMRILAERFIRDIYATQTLETALTNKDAVDSVIKTSLQVALNGYQAGVQISDVQVQNTQLTDTVQVKYKDIESANQYIKEQSDKATTFETQRINKANEEATKVRQEAEQYASNVITAATEDTQKFLKMYEEYKVNPGVIREKIYTDTMKVFLKENRFIIDLSDGSGGLKFVDINKLLIDDKKEGTN